MEAEALIRLPEHAGEASAEADADAPVDQESVDAPADQESAGSGSEADPSEPSTSDEEEGCFPELYAAVVGPVLDESGDWIGHTGGDEQKVEKLLREGTDVDVQTPQGWTPLMVSGSTGQPHMMLRLVLAVAGAPSVARAKPATVSPVAQSTKGSARSHSVVR